MPFVFNCSYLKASNKMKRTATIATSALTVCALDFSQNLSLIEESIDRAKKQGARFRSGPELEISGYDCNDHFLERDTEYHSWEVLAALLTNESHKDIIVDVGMPVSYNGVLYNCRVVFLNREILLIRPKTILCDTEIYCETRWFNAWSKLKQSEELTLPDFIQAIAGQKTVPIGDIILQTNDTSIGFEICEELWNTQSRHIDMGLDGVEIFVNSSGEALNNHTGCESRDLIKSATFKSGGCYLYTNLKGCGGDRYYYKGNSSIAFNGEIICANKLYTLSDVDVLTTTVDLDEIKSFRYSIRSRCLLADAAKRFPKVKANFTLCSNAFPPTLSPLKEVDYPFEFHILEGTACWLFDYFRRSSASGILLTYSHDASTLISVYIVYTMCEKIAAAVRDEHQKEKMKEDLKRIFSTSSTFEDAHLTDAKSICRHLLTILHVSVQESCDKESKSAEQLTNHFGSSFHKVDISKSLSELLTSIAGKEDKWAESTFRETADRMRLVTAYTFAKNKNQELLVLGKGNTDQIVMGNYTKFGTLSGDLSLCNGVGLEKQEAVVQYAAKRFGVGDVKVVVGVDEEKMVTFTKLRKAHFCGPYAMFLKSMNMLGGEMSEEDVLSKVSLFFGKYATSRHKVLTIPPALTYELYPCEDSRADFRPILYSHNFSWQFGKIRKLIDEKK